jgi:hypothetical protein
VYATLNRYTYAINNPLSYRDPTGRFIEGLGQAIQDQGGWVNNPVAGTDWGSQCNQTPSSETYEASPGAWVTMNTDACGNTTFVTTAPTGVNIASEATGADRSGNLGYTPTSQVHLAAASMAMGGFTAAEVKQSADMAIQKRGGLTNVGATDIITAILDDTMGQDAGDNPSALDYRAGMDSTPPTTVSPSENRPNCKPPTGTTTPSTTQPCKPHNWGAATPWDKSKAQMLKAAGSLLAWSL